MGLEKLVGSPGNSMSDEEIRKARRVRRTIYFMRSRRKYKRLKRRLRERYGIYVASIYQDPQIDCFVIVWNTEVDTTVRGLRVTHYDLENLRSPRAIADHVGVAIKRWNPL